MQFEHAKQQASPSSIVSLRNLAGLDAELHEAVMTHEALALADSGLVFKALRLPTRGNAQYIHAPQQNKIQYNSTQITCDFPTLETCNST